MIYDNLNPPGPLLGVLSDTQHSEYSLNAMNEGPGSQAHFTNPVPLVEALPIPSFARISVTVVLCLSPDVTQALTTVNIPLAMSQLMRTGPHDVLAISITDLWVAASHNQNEQAESFFQIAVSDNYQVGTSRAPFWGRDHQDMEYGFRSLGSAQHIASGHATGIVPAIHSFSPLHTSAVDLYNSYMDIGLSLATYFMLFIFKPILFTRALLASSASPSPSSSPMHSPSLLPILSLHPVLTGTPSPGISSSRSSSVSSTRQTTFERSHTRCI